METNQKPKRIRFATALIITTIIASLMVGGLLGYSIANSTNTGTISNLQGQLSALQEQILKTKVTQEVTNVTYVTGDNASLSQLYAQVKDSIVMIQGVTVQYDVFHRAYYTQVQGSGFVYNFTGRMVIVTNYHVVQNTINTTITFINGNGYAATMLGSDPYADLAVLSADAPQSEYAPLQIAGSSTLKVGDSVIAVGNPYGLAGSMTTGIVSALGRTITEEMSGSYPIANVIQTSAPINPGNSGGPLMNYLGQVVGITTAIVTDSQGLGFAIPSSTILREIESLITLGSYTQHPWLGASGVDMTYEIAKAMSVNVTYGWLIVQITNNGPADEAHLQGGTQQIIVAGDYVTIGGDIITAINGVRITNMDALSTFLEENTLPNQTIDVTIVRNNETMICPPRLGTRP